MEKRLESPSSSEEKGKRPLRSTLGATVRFVRDKKSKEKEGVSKKLSQDDEPSRVEVEEQTSSTRKRSTSWRFAAMFTKSQNNPKPDKALSKQSVFPGNSNLLKKKARNTILSVLTKRQTQEKVFLGEKTDGREQLCAMSSSEPSLQKTSWTPEPMVVDLTSPTARTNQQRPTSVVVRSTSYQFTPSNQPRPSSESYERTSPIKTHEESKVSSQIVEDDILVHEAETSEAGIDIVDGTTRWPPQPRDPASNQSGTSDQSLGSRRPNAPRQLSSPLEESSTSEESAGAGTGATVVSMSPSYTSKKDITQKTPLSPKSVSDSVMVSIPFQVHGQQQPWKSDARSDVWSSSVSVCVPFQVNENGEGVSVLPTTDNHSPPSTSSAARNAFPSSNLVKVLESPKLTRVRLASTEGCEILDSGPENDNFAAIEEIAATTSSLPVESSLPLPSVVEPDKHVFEDETDGSAVTKPRAHSTPTAEKRKPPKDEPGKTRKVSKEVQKTMGKEASKHKSTDKSATSAALKVPPGGKPRAKSFTAGEKLTTNSKEKSPSGSPSSLSPAGTPTGTPKSRSPTGSPKPARGNATPKNNMNKSRSTAHGTPDQKKQENKGRPNSDPLVAEKLQAKKKPPAGANRDHTAAGRSKPDSEALRNKITELEDERSKSHDKMQAMEHQLAVIPLLEKEKLQLQKQLNELTQRHEKQKSDLDTLNLSSNKLNTEKGDLQSKYDNALVELENSRVEIEELKDQNFALDEVKTTLARENEQKLEAIDKHMDNIEKLTTANTTLVLQEGRFRNKISALFHGLQSLKGCVVKLRDENKCLQSDIIANGSELVGTMKNCVNGLEKVIDGLEKESNDEARKRALMSVDVDKIDKETQCTQLESTETILEELKESKERVESLLNKINELEMEKTTSEEQKDNENEKDSINIQVVKKEDHKEFELMDCTGCRELLAKLESMRCDFESQKVCLQKSETEREEAVEERKDLRRETKYLKYVLSYREDVQGIQMTKQQNKELEKMGANLNEAEAKVNDLEGEVGRLQQEKQTLLLSILNLNCGHEVEDVEEVDEEEEEEETTESEESDEEEADNKEEEKNKEKVQREASKSPSTDSASGARTPDSISRREQLKFRFQLSLSESDYSCYTEGEEESESELEQTDNELTSQAKNIKMENKHLKSTLSEAVEEKEELLASLDKLCDEFDSLKERYDKLDEAHTQLSDKAKSDKRVLQARLKEADAEKIAMRDSLRQIQDEKLALLKCLEMKNAVGPPESPLPDLDVNQIIARAQSFVDKETKTSEPTSNEDDSEESSSSGSEDEAEPPPLPRKKLEGKETPEKRVGPEGQPEVPTSHPGGDRELQSIVASIESDLGILKEKLKRKGDDVPGDVGGGVEPRPPKPPPGARILRRQASTVKSNLDRVCREKKHLEHEVDSLRRYLLKRRDSAMDTRRRPSVGSLKRQAGEVETHLDAIKTLQELLGKSDNQLQTSNEVISRLESLNDDTEDKLRDAEMLQDDLRRAVQIANNFAMEEQEKSENMAKHNQELLRQIEIMKSKDQSVEDKASLKGKHKLQLKSPRSAKRLVSEDESLYADDESAMTTEGESDFYSSRHSSIASESDFVRSSTPDREKDVSESSHDQNSNVISRGGSEEEFSKGGDTETEGATSQHSSTVDSSDTEDEDDGE